MRTAAANALKNAPKEHTMASEDFDRLRALVEALEARVKALEDAKKTK